MEISVEETKKLAKAELNELTNLVLFSGFYSIEKVPLHVIKRETDLSDYLQIEFSISDDVNKKIVSDLKIISRLDIKSKQVLYCVHCLGIDRSHLKESFGSKEYNPEYSIGSPYEDYEKALLKFGLTQENTIVYCEGKN